MEFAANLIDLSGCKRRKEEKRKEEPQHEPNTNVILAKFDKLVKKNLTFSGDAYKCNNCEAYLSNISTVSDSNLLDKRRTWKCEFCSFENKIKIEKEEIPKEQEITYLIQPPVDENDIKLNIDTAFGSNVVYCIDISGSMSITTKVPGNFHLPTDIYRRTHFENATGESMFQPMRMSQYNEKHISRLEAVQLAISENLSNLAKNNSTKRVSIVAFNRKVRMLGDGKVEELTIEGDLLNEKEQIKDLAKNKALNLSAIGQSKDNLTEKLLKLEEGGQTALGPALLYSAEFASSKRGSQVILCTDGMANIGLGSFENNDQQETTAFYDEIAEFCINKGVSVSIITIEGTNCKLGILGDIPNRTQGTVQIVNPLNLKSQFSSILEDEIVATNVEISLILHKALFIRDHTDLNNKQSYIKKKIGNVTKETEFTFEFGIREDCDIDLKTIKKLPFQMQIVYNIEDGSKMLKILTSLKEITDDKQEAEKSANQAILATHMIQEKSRLVQLDKSTDAIDKYEKYIHNINSSNKSKFSFTAFNAANQNISNIQAISSNIKRPTPSAPSASASNRTQTNMFALMEDETARDAYQNSKINSKNFKK